MLITADMYREKYPNVYDFVKDQLYVDDGTYSVESNEEALRLAKDTCYVLAQGGFVVKHFIVGGSALDITNVSSDLRNLPEKVRIAGVDAERILGLSWCPGPDTIKFLSRVNLHKKFRGARSGPNIVEDEFDSSFPESLTLRQYMSQVCSHFDPSGLSTPVTIVMKHELGLLFLIGGGWDDNIPRESSRNDLPTSYERCREIIRMFFALSKVEFPRCLLPPECPSDAPVILVVFCDASQMSYCAVVNYNWETPSGLRLSRVFCAKARPVPKCAPLLTIPRAEAMGAVLGVQLAKNVQEQSTYNFDRRLFLLDSKIHPVRSLILFFSYVGRW